MRISETKVVQLVDSTPPQLVLVNDIDGCEMSLSPQEVANLRIAVDYFQPHIDRLERQGAVGRG